MLESIQFPRAQLSQAGVMPELVLRSMLMVSVLCAFTFVIVTSFNSMAPQTIRIQSAYETTPYFDDFVVFTAAGSLAGPSQPYDLDLLSAEEARLTGEDRTILTLPFFNPPQFLIPLAVLARFPLGQAAIVWFAAGTVTMLGGFWAIGRSRLSSLDGAAVILWPLGIVSSLSFVQAVVHGQLTFFLVAGFCLVWLGAFRSHRPAIVAVGLSVIAAKPALLLGPILWLLISRQWRSLATFAGLQIVLLGLSLTIFGLDLVSRYLTLTLKALTWDDVNGISSYGMFGWHGLIRGLAGPGNRDVQSLLTLGLSTATLALLAVCLSRANRTASREQAFAATIVASLLISPHSYSQDLLFLAPALFLLSTGRESRGFWAAAGLLTWLAIRIHFPVLATSGIGPANIILVILFALLALRIQRVPTPEVSQSTHVLLHSGDTSSSSNGWLVWPANAVLFAALILALLFTSGMKGTGLGVGYYALPTPESGLGPTSRPSTDTVSNQDPDSVPSTEPPKTESDENQPSDDEPDVSSAAPDEPAQDAP